MEFIVKTLALKLGYLVQILVLPFITHFNLVIYELSQASGHLSRKGSDNHSPEHTSIRIVAGGASLLGV